MKKITYLIVAAFTMLVSTSCSDFLDPENKGAGKYPDAMEYFGTSEGLQQFRTNAFARLNDVATAHEINDDGTDLYEPCRGQAPSVFHNFTLSSENKDLETYYTNCTKLTNNANGLIKFAAGKNDVYVAEGKFLRALGYYYMTQHFGSVPYVSNYIESSTREYPKTPLEEIYTNIEKDLEDVIASNVPEMSTDGTVNKKAAKALLAKVYLAHGWDIHTTVVDAASGTYSVTSKEYFTKAANMAEQALNGMSLTQSFEQKWNPENDAENPETFFAVQYKRSAYPGDLTEGGHKLCNYYCHYYGSGTKTSTSNKALNTRSLAMWEKGDERWAGTFMTTVYNFDKKVADWSKAGYYAYYNNNVDKDKLHIWMYFAPTYVTKAEFEAYLAAHKAQFVKTSDDANVPHANLLLNGQILRYEFNADGTFKLAKTDNQNLSTNNTGTSLEVSPCVKKYDDPATPNAGTTNSYTNIPLLHASEIYLTAAEAYYMAGEEGKAWEKINAVRDRAKAPALNNSLSNYGIEVKFSNNFTLLNLILDERARETYAELTRWMDLRRTKQLVRYNVAYNNYINSVADMQNLAGEIKWYHPIPQTEINSNTGLSQSDQNPGY
ncbi:MAG: RagB/SusD family nutrient uptake outer membrane protein [Bacteroidales bacterium]|nr:RagB/SusD family nutrient uptake outer membrane protein [Bacteroidales bacterium]MCM1147230.1 RagB/SusD family nutrient uptake outer membrane protein [Bacteroidales bacterium]MCM1207235.1 RagB/SusD family nutrient uptake outer membrane protein [Bacillota bacterium]MCM1509740.1 RagB/SusD family nutrient uptake outer membrane protein [Clostridium sp.]